MENKEVKISFWASHLTTIVSVTLVLLLVGIIAMVWVCADNETRRLRELVELSAVMSDSIGNAQANEIGRRISSAPFSKRVVVISKEQALKNWADETGEDLAELYGVNPLTPEVSFTLKADWNSVEKIEAVKNQVSAIPGVESVDAPESEMVEAMNSNIAGMTLVLGVVAIVMLVISFVLINNTVQLTIYSRRFTIHTMQLVGATNGFISRPVVSNNALSGLIAGMLASLFLAVAMACAPYAGIGNINSYISWPVFGCIAGGMMFVGVVLCALTAWIATAKYLRKDYDELFR